MTTTMTRAKKRKKAGGDQEGHHLATGVRLSEESTFDYDTLSEEDRKKVRSLTVKIKEAHKRAITDILNIGRWLIQAKKRLPHGQFLPWLSTEFGWHRDLANKFMHAAKQFGGEDLSKITTFSPSALYILASPSTPEPARKEAMDLAKSAGRVTHKQANRIVSRHKKASRTEQASRTEEERKQARTDVEGAVEAGWLEVPDGKSQEMTGGLRRFYRKVRDELKRPPIVVWRGGPLGLDRVRVTHLPSGTGYTVGPEGVTHLLRAACKYATCDDSGMVNLQWSSFDHGSGEVSVRREDVDDLVRAWNRVIDRHKTARATPE